MGAFILARRAGRPAIAPTLRPHREVERVDRHRALHVLEREVRVAPTMPGGRTAGPDRGDHRFAGMGGLLEPGSHHTEECYVILRGRGTMTLNGEAVEVGPGTFIHLPPWCEHGVEITGNETLEILICTSPPNP